MSFRLDTGTIHKSEKTPDGFLRIYANFSKVGPLRYLRADGSIQIEHVTEDTLFNEDSLQTASLKPITLLHPKEKIVTPQNARQEQRGFVGNTIYKNYPYATIVATVTDAEAIESIESGKTTQISAGYRCLTRQRADGEFEQVNRNYNHFALVPNGRAGADVCLHLDGEDDFAVAVLDDGNDTENKADADGIAIAFPSGRVFEFDDQDCADEILELIAKVGDCECEPEETETDDEEQTGMELYQAMGFDSAEEALQGYQELKTKADLMQPKLDAAEGTITGLKSQLSEAQTKLDAAESNRIDESDISKEAAARAEAWNVVLPVLRMDSPDFQPDFNLGVADIRKLAIAKKMPDLNLDGKSDDYVSALWDAISPNLEKQERQDSSRSLLDDLNNAIRQDGSNCDLDTAKAKRAARIAGNARKIMEG